MIPDPVVLYLSVAVVIISIVVSFATVVILREHRSNNLLHQVEELERKVGVMSLPIQQIDVALKRVLVDELTHFHTPRLDYLIQKLGPPFTLTVGEFEELVSALRARSEDLDGELDEVERSAAQMLPIVAKRLATQNTASQPEFNLILVGVPKSAEKATVEEATIKKATVEEATIKKAVVEEAAIKKAGK